MLPPIYPSSRRQFLRTTGAVTGALVAGCTSLPLAARGIIDTHTHFYDPRRPQGVPWPPKDDDLLYRPVLPDEYKAFAQLSGVIGTVVVEASAWREDNQWVLDLIHHDPFLLGLVGNLKPGSPEFADDLRRYSKNRRFRGIRIGSEIVLRAQTEKRIVDDLRQLADADLSLDVLIGPDHMLPTVALAKQVPGLRLIIDHCSNVRIDGEQPPAPWLRGLRECHYQPNIWMKVSGLVEGTGRVDHSAPADVAYYRPVLDAVWGAFGEDRIVYGSNWPVSERFGAFRDALGIVESYFTARGSSVAQKYFLTNARRFYKLPS